MQIELTENEIGAILKLIAASDPLKVWAWALGDKIYQQMQAQKKKEQEKSDA